MSSAVAVPGCPACGDASARQIGEDATGFETVIDGRHFLQPPYAVRCCPSCGLYFKTATLAAVDLQSYYQALDSAAFEHDGDYPTDRLLSRRLDALPDGNRVLDFGCSTGRILRRHAARLRCFGVEPNAGAAALARSRGIEVVTEEALREGRWEFDAILLTDVYEHLSEPVPFVELLARRLSARGWLAIVTGNADAIPARDSVAEFWYFRLPGHVIMATERHLRWLAARIGVELSSMHRCSHYRTPARERLRQRAQAFAYRRFRSAPRGLIARLLRALPRVSAAERWPTAPAVTCGADHVVAFFNRSPSRS